MYPLIVNALLSSRTSNVVLGFVLSPFLVCMLLCASGRDNYVLGKIILDPRSRRKAPSVKCCQEDHVLSIVSLLQEPIRGVSTKPSSSAVLHFKLTDSNLEHSSTDMHLSARPQGATVMDTLNSNVHFTMSRPFTVNWLRHRKTIPGVKFSAHDMKPSQQDFKSTTLYSLNTLWGSHKFDHSANKTLHEGIPTSSVPNIFNRRSRSKLRKARISPSTSRGFSRGESKNRNKGSEIFHPLIESEALILPEIISNSPPRKDESSLPVYESTSYIPTLRGFVQAELNYDKTISEKMPRFESDLGFGQVDKTLTGSEFPWHFSDSAQTTGYDEVYNLRPKRQAIGGVINVTRDEEAGGKTITVSKEESHHQSNLAPSADIAQVVTPERNNNVKRSDRWNSSVSPSALVPNSESGVVTTNNGEDGMATQPGVATFGETLYLASVQPPITTVPVRTTKTSVCDPVTPHTLPSDVVNCTTAGEQWQETVKIGVILPFHGPFPWAIAKTHPALQLAVDRIEREEILPGKRIELIIRDSVCSQTYGPLMGIELYVAKAAHVFVGPACDYAVAPLARFSFRWQIPILTAGALVSAFHDRNEYRLLTRVQGPYSKAGDFLMTVFKHWRWKKTGLVYHDPRNSSNDSRSNCYFIMEAIFFAVREAFGEEPWYVQYNSNEQDQDGYRKLLLGASLHARVVVLCASQESVREIMIKAHELNFDNGEYVFFNIDLFSSKNDTKKPWYRANDTPERNANARKAYEALMSVTLRKPTSPEYRKFSEEVKQRASDMYPNFTYGEEEVNSFVGAFHDAVLLYALALNETLAANGSISDGATITKRMWNRTFEGITGNVSIDDNGDRNADYSLLDLNPVTGDFEVVANYYGNKKEYEPVPGKSIHWAGGRKTPPLDTPVCGFDGTKCPPDEPFPEYGIVIIVLGSILVIVIVAVFFIYRHIKLEAELAEMNWRVRWDDILFGSPEKNKNLERHNSKHSLVRKTSFASSASGDTIAFQLSDAGNRQLFTKTGYYKGAIIAIKSIVRTNITVSKPLLLEIKRMKDLQNDHIVRFIGACMDIPNQCILTEYCPKGSLQHLKNWQQFDCEFVFSLMNAIKTKYRNRLETDHLDMMIKSYQGSDVLENDQIKLDWMFRYSIMQDIVRGMAYLHGTDIRSHGNLKSTNCVVDSRFVVKITDFGLHYFRSSGEITDDDNAYRNYHSKLWSAPELLRMYSPPLEGTQKGDVYSFAIICQEIVYRNGVFYLHNLDATPQDIYAKVKNGLKPFFRPTLEEYDCPCDELADVIRRCWAEDPSDRPDFTQLKSIIRKLNRDGDKGNILDNLLSRMEQYANNLEALVEERTADYLQQKKKAEDLLYSMLPRSVALQLIRGESVTAESYDNVSIYFSDICGFTAMSAESTPMQVVDLLNDLYTTFDSIIENFDVYKVETIGDAYMVVSGLPERNGDLHAREIARMSLSLLDAVLSFRIRHRPREQLKLRIGIHSGPVCTGVVGHKMPRYCLFGDTVNTASRMESNGLPLRIHVSPATKQVLDKFSAFELESRGEVEMKGKGLIHTYWLLGERPVHTSPGTTLSSS